MKMLVIVAVLSLAVGFGVGYWRGCLWANLKCYELGYDLGFQSAIIPGQTVVDVSTGKKYKMVEE